jgi:Fatty acid desaturase
VTVSSAKSQRQAAVTDIPAALNLYFCAFYACVNLYQFIVLPLWLLPMDNRWGWTLAPLLLLTNSFWSLIHEAIHDLLHPDRRVNTAMGRLFSVMFGSPLRILRSSHLLHHKLNRAPMEGTEYYEKEQTSFAAACFGYYFQILGGLYLVEFLSPLLFFLPRSLLERFKRRFLQEPSVSAILMQSWMQKESWREIRIDGAASLLWFGLAHPCMGLTGRCS